ncbi:MAG: ABC transporter ATP-binding protein [Sphaerochaetaceae bacterium]
MTPNILEVAQLEFRYGSEPILSKIGFSILPGDFVALIGGNGAGKSTLFRLLLGELTPSKGTIRLFGQDIRQFRNWPSIGYVPQNGFASKANFPATVEEIVQANLFSQIGLFHFPQKADKEQTKEALQQVGMENYAKHLIGNLSGGQQQRVMLARVIVNKPKLMILDEPGTGVDTKTLKTLYEFLAKLNRETGLTIVMATHDIERISVYSSRTLSLERGTLVELDSQQSTGTDATIFRPFVPKGLQWKQERKESYGDFCV